MQHIKHYSLGLLVVFALLLGALISAQPALAKDGTMKGNGTQESPYQIEDAKDLIEFARRVNDNDPISEKEGELNAWAELKKDIDLENTSWTPIAYNYEHPYSGTFDGNNHTISGLSINNSSTNYGYFGLFGAVGEGGTVTNLTVEGSITVNSGSNVRAGGVVASNDGDVSNCTSEVAITVEANIAYIGGIIGSNAGNFSNCTNKTDITVTADTAYIGGVIGFNGGLSQIAATAALSREQVRLHTLAASLAQTTTLKASWAASKTATIPALSQQLAAMQLLAV